MIGLLVFFLSLFFYYVTLCLVVRFVFLYFRQLLRIFNIRAAFQRWAKKRNIKAEPQRSALGIMFGNKGDVDYIITLDERKYLISIITFPYGKRRMRWNIEKDENNGFAYIEARFYSGFLYKEYKRANKELDFSYYCNYETVFERHRLFLNDEFCCETEKRLLLFATAPEHLTCSGIKFRFLNSGDVIEDYEIYKLDR